MLTIWSINSFGEITNRLIENDENLTKSNKEGGDF